MRHRISVLQPTIDMKSYKLKMNVFEIADDLRVHSYCNYEANRFSTLHSIGITDNYYVIYLVTFLSNGCLFCNSLCAASDGNGWQKSDRREYWTR